MRSMNNRAPHTVHAYCSLLTQSIFINIIIDCPLLNLHWIVNLFTAIYLFIQLKSLDSGINIKAIEPQTRCRTSTIQPLIVHFNNDPLDLSAKIMFTSTLDFRLDVRDCMSK